MVLPFGCFILVFLLLPALYLLVWVVKAGLGRQGGTIAQGIRRADAVCGWCGHTAGIDETARCSECGRRYDQAGVATRALAIRLGPPLTIITLLLLPIAIAIGGVTAPIVGSILTQVQYRVSNPMHTKYNYSARPTGTYDDRIQNLIPDYQLTVISDGIIDGRATVQPLISGTITLRLDGSDVQDTEVVWSVDDQRWQLRDDAGNLIAEGDDIEQAVEAAYQRSGADSLWKGSPDELADAQRMIRMTIQNSRVGSLSFSSAMNDYGLQSMGGGGGTSSASASTLSPMRTAMMIIAGVLPLALLVLVVFLIHQARRRVLNAVAIQASGSAPAPLK